MKKAIKKLKEWHIKSIVKQMLKTDEAERKLIKSQLELNRMVALRDYYRKKNLEYEQKIMNREIDQKHKNEPTS